MAKLTKEQKIEIYKLRLKVETYKIDFYFLYKI